MIKTSLHGIQKTDLTTIQAIHHMISSIQHMTNEDIRNIDERSYLITIPIKHIDEANRLKNVIYTKIRKSFGFNDQDVKIGLISCSDIGGTRNGSNIDLDWNNPHIHATMFLPRQVAPQSETDQEKMKLSIRRELLSLYEVEERVRDGRRLDIRKYDPRLKSLFDMESYGSKADTRFIHQKAEAFTTWTFPHDPKSGSNMVLDTSDERIQDLLFKLHLYPEFILANPRLDRLTPIQSQYRLLHESASSSVERRRIKQRFIRLIT
jgi:hypothetical protein